MSADQPAAHTSTAKKVWGVVRTLTTIALPWLVLLYVSWIGVHWTAIGMGAIYAASLLVAIGCVIGQSRG